jgi:uncharacterized Zn finger protein (UPF0148 family)
MHSAACPSCGTRVELDFQPTAGLIWCPKCEKVFIPPVESGPEPPQTEQIERPDPRNGIAK